MTTRRHLPTGTFSNRNIFQQGPTGTFAYGDIWRRGFLQTGMFVVCQWDICQWDVFFCWEGSLTTGTFADGDVCQWECLLTGTFANMDVCFPTSTFPNLDFFNMNICQQGPTGMCAYGRLFFGVEAKTQPKKTQNSMKICPKLNQNLSKTQFSGKSNFLNCPKFSFSFELHLSYCYSDDNYWWWQSKIDVAFW